ncbi:MAG: hypothetical protein NC311_05525 [Muribaculaceae bacterium]|nr:hypothetical protein [Muribaculaceae bacterium]
MTRDPVHNTISPEESALLASIFRLILQEIRTDEDKHKLAPGELGINYKTKTLYIRNPYTGDIFSPNSLEHLAQILTKYDYKNNILNADRVSEITFYNRLTQLDKLGIDFTPDSVIRQMHGPAILFSAVEYANYETLGWPSDSGICVAYKSDEEHVLIRYYDNRTYITYEGRYNHAKHLFEGWAIGGGSGDSIYAETIGGGDSTVVRIEPYDMELQDLMIITVRVTETLNPGATIAVNSYPQMPIVTKDGEPLGTYITPNNIIMLVYDKPNSKWILLDSTESAMHVVVAVTAERLELLKSETERQFIEIGNRITNEVTAVENRFNERITALSKSFTEVITNVNAAWEKKFEALRTAPGNIVARVSNVKIDSDGVKGIPIIAEFDGHVDQLVVNYNQTVLRIGVDYIITDTGIDFTDNITLMAGDEVQFVVLKQNKL